MALQSPIFIVGPGRSGTTLMRSLLSAHPNISIAPETQFMGWVEQRADLRGSPADFDSFWKRYTSWVRFKDLDIDPERCLELIEEQGAPPTFERVFRAVLVAYGERVGKPRIGEKSPSHVHYLSLLFDWFPDACALIMQRDPRAIIASQLKTPYVLERVRPISLREGVFLDRRLGQVVGFAEEWVGIDTALKERWRHDGRVRAVQYEALVTNPEAELRSLCDFLAEPYESTMLTERASGTVPMPAGQTPDQVLERWRRGHHARSLAPVSTDSLDKWKKGLSAMEVAVIEGLCEHGMRAAGYRFSTSMGRRLLGRLFARAFKAAAAVERRARRLAAGIRRRLVRQDSAA